MSQKYVIVHFIDKTSLSDDFLVSEWPLHITLLANFAIHQPIGQLKQELADYAQQIRPFEIVVEGNALFGPNKNVAVSLIKPDHNIISVHNSLVSITTKLGVVYDEPAFMNDGYRPHATIQTNARLFEGQTVMLDGFALVDMYPDNDMSRRRIIQTFQLGD